MVNAIATTKLIKKSDLKVPSERMTARATIKEPGKYKPK
jgi:hypothetical protein